MFRFFKKNKQTKEVTRKDLSVYNGQAYRGTFEIDGLLVEGIYVRDGHRTFISKDGVANISKGVKISQITKVSCMSKDIEKIYNDLMAGYCTPFTFIK